jgi:hypothetical protein
MSAIVYGATMFPGLAGIGDTPKFQFVGAVLGTPHSPGYPLYILLSWLFSRLPVGSVAFRSNLMSGVFAATAVALLVLALRALGCRRSIAVAGALAIGLGRVFWSQAILAEVYTLNALLFAGVVLFLARWTRTRSPRDLAWACVFFSLGLAHHLTLAMAGPAFVAYVFAVDRRAITARSVAWAAAAAAAALSSYLFIWVRTRWGAPFLEVRAETLRDLIPIIAGRQFQHALFAFAPDRVFSERLPAIFRWIADELRWYGVALAALGFAVVLCSRRRRPEALLLGGSAASVLFFALNYNVVDIQVFLIIPMIACSLAAALGADWLADRLPARPGAVAAAAITLAALAWPAAQYRANVRANNHHRHTFEAAYFDALFDLLPARTAIVAESYPVDNMLLYKLLGENAARGRRIEIIPTDAGVVRDYVEHGFTVLAFLNGRSTLEFEVPFAVVDLPLPKPGGGRHVADTEVPELAYPLSIVTLPGRHARQQTLPQRLPEPMTGAVWQPVIDREVVR